MFITFEGPDGCGKSTQARLLAQSLEQMGVDVLLTREPGGTEIGRKVRQIILSHTSEGMGPEAEALLYAADRAQHVFEVLKPALSAGKVVISDRFVDSSYAYQAVALNVGMGAVKAANDIAVAGLKPDLTILLDVDPQTGIGRVRRSRAGSNAEIDRIEARDLDYHARVRRAYLDMAAGEPRRIRVVDAAANSAEEVRAEVLDIVLGAMGMRQEGCR